MKNAVKYFNTLTELNSDKWEVIDGTDENLMQLSPAEDPDTGDYTRLTFFRAGYNTRAFGAKSHDYPEEVFIVSGRLYDEAFDLWLEPGYYANRPPGESHGPFKASEDTIVLEVSYLSQKNCE